MTRADSPAPTSRRVAPVWRVLGSAVSWLLFTFCFTLLAVGAAIVMGLGGFCASGGPYVIQTQCPDVVVWSTPVAIFGGLISVALGAIVAQGFGTPLTAWAWPILFIGLGLTFLFSGLAAGVDGIVFDLLAVMFVLMGGVPLVLELRASPQSFFLGTSDAAGEPFAVRDTGRRSLYSFRTTPSTTNARAATARDWATSLALLVVFGGGGVVLALLLLGPHPAG